MNLKKIFKTFALSVSFVLASQPTTAQDLLARQAPVDRKMKAVDTLVLKKIIERENNISPAADLYDGWDNKYAHRATALPDSFKINLPCNYK